MFFQIISNTPVWVWGLLAVLLALGFKQSRRASLSLKRVIILPVAMTGLSVLGVISAFGTAPAGLLAWTVAAIVAGSLVWQLPTPAGTRYDAASDSFEVPGSWIPLALMVGIFATKYVVGVALAMHLPLTQAPVFGLATSALYGSFSGVFIGRAARLCRLAWAPGKVFGLVA